MNAAEWERIKALFDAALKIPREDRTRWVCESCEDRPELCETIIQLLQNYEECSWQDPREIEPGPIFSPCQIVADRFMILRLIARGGMGEVYEARDNHLNGIRIALKTLRLGLATERQAHDRFKREVWVAREIVHEGICRMFDLVEHKVTAEDGTEIVIPCLTMKLLEGESLTDFLTRKRPLSPAEALPLIQQIADSLQAMHEKQIVHRDLKPSNVMLVPAKDGNGLRVILVDFGLAKPLNNNADVWETRTEQNQAGAPFFVAPEVLKGQKGAVAADIYAFGLLIDEMVTHRPAFRYNSIEELFWRKLHDEPERPAHRSNNLPAHWEDTILRCLSRDPDQRPTSASAVAKALNTPLFGVSKLLRKVQYKYTSLRANSQLTSSLLSRRLWIGTAASATLVSGAMAVLGTHPIPLTSSILIFPFQNLTRRDDYEHLCTGTTEELIRRLSYIKGLNIFPIPRSWNADASAIRTARFSLKGSLQYFDGRVRLSVRLVENENDMLIWADTFDRLLKDPLALESEIAEKVVDGIRQRASETGDLFTRIRSTMSLESFQRNAIGLQKSDLPGAPTGSNYALDEYQQGRELWQRRTLPAALEAIACFQRAIEADPQFALAYAALADVQQTLLNYNYGSTEHLLAEALHYAEKAVALDNSLPECHVARAAARQDLWDWNESEKSYRVAIAQHPKFARAHHWFAGLLLQFGQFENALGQARIGLALDPFDYPSHSNFGLYLWEAGRLKEAAKQLEGVLAKVDLIYAHTVLGQVYAALAASSPEPDATNYFVRSLSEAALVYSRDMEVAGGIDPGYLKWSDLIFAQAHAARRDRSSVQHYADRLERGFEAGKISASAVAWAYAAVDNRNRTLELLEYGLEHHEREMLYVRVIPLFRNLHTEPRFQRILQQMKLA